MRRLVLAGAVCAACISWGWWQRVRYRRRLVVWQDMRAFLAYCDEQIGYNMAALPAICASFAALHPRSALSAAVCAYPDLAEVRSLPADEWQEMREVLLSLGKSDVAGQTGRLAYAKARVDKMCAAADSDSRRKGDLWAKLGALAGVALMIWMV